MEAHALRGPVRARSVISKARRPCKSSARLRRIHSVGAAAPPGPDHHEGSAPESARNSSTLWPSRWARTARAAANRRAIARRHSAGPMVGPSRRSTASAGPAPARCCSTGTLPPRFEDQGKVFTTQPKAVVWAIDGAAKDTGRKARCFPRMRHGAIASSRVWPSAFEASLRQKQLQQVPPRCVALAEPTRPPAAL